MTVSWRPLSYVLMCAVQAWAQPGVSPPNGYILLTEQNSVVLSWPGEARGYQFVLWQDGRKLMDCPLETNSLAVSVKPGGSYRWLVTPVGGKSSVYDFSVAERWEFHADGQDGFGGGGKNVAVRLERGADGMRMQLECGGQSKEYLFVSEGKRFLISSHGGSGRNSDSSTAFYEYTVPGRPAGPGGWGGNIVVSTRQAPWRTYLQLDVSGGRGGAGNSEYVDGTDGQAGRVTTKILP